MSHNYSLTLDLTGRLIVIVGGGAVAARKAIGLTESGATRIRAVAADFRVPFPPQVLCVTRAYLAEDLKGANLVFAATDSATINDAIVRDAHAWASGLTGPTAASRPPVTLRRRPSFNPGRFSLRCRLAVLP